MPTKSVEPFAFACVTGDYHQFLRCSENDSVRTFNSTSQWEAFEEIGFVSTPGSSWHDGHPMFQERRMRWRCDLGVFITSSTNLPCRWSPNRSLGNLTDKPNYFRGVYYRYKKHWHLTDTRLLYLFYSGLDMQKKDKPWDSPTYKK